MEKIPDSFPIDILNADPETVEVKTFSLDGADVLSRADQRTVEEGAKFSDVPFKDHARLKRAVMRDIRRETPKPGRLIHTENGVILPQPVRERLDGIIADNLLRLKDIQAKKLADIEARLEKVHSDTIFEIDVGVNTSFYVLQDQIKARGKPVLFDEEIIACYVLDADIRKQLGGAMLFCNDEIFTRLRISGTAEEKSAKLNSLIGFNCRNNIGVRYVSGSILKAITMPDKYQMLVALGDRETIVGFIIAELGECGVHPTVWSVRLVCTAHPYSETPKKVEAWDESRHEMYFHTIPCIPYPDVNAISANVLIGAMLYSLLMLEQEYAILELARGYINSAGFIAYSKLGFIKNLTLFWPGCFTARGNLPMYVSLRGMTAASLTGMITGRKLIQLDPSQDDTGFYRRYLDGDRYTMIEALAANYTYQALLQADPRRSHLVGRRDDYGDSVLYRRYLNSLYEQRTLLKNRENISEIDLEAYIPSYPILMPETYALVSTISVAYQGEHGTIVRKGGTRRRKRRTLRKFHP